MIGLSSTIRNDRLQIVLDAIDSGADEYDTALLWIFSGERPATGEAVDEYENELLVEFVLPFPCGTITDNVLTFDSVADSLGIIYGIASWARIVDSSGNFVMDLSVSDLSGNGDVKIDYLEIFEDNVVHCESITITEGNP